MKFEESFRGDLGNLREEYYTEKMKLNKLFVDIAKSRDSHNRIIEDLFDLMDKADKKSKLNNSKFHNQHPRKYVEDPHLFN